MDATKEVVWMEEDQFDWYTPNSFYPVRIGETFHSRYKVLLKLGYGSVSTAWLCRDLQTCEFVTLKVFITDHRQSRNEFRVLEQLRSIEAEHPGKKLVRTALDTFTIEGRAGIHRCLVHAPLAMPMSDVRTICGGPVPLQVLKSMLQSLFITIDFLHRAANAIHTDIQDDNIMIESMDPSFWDALEERERAMPTPEKTIGDSDTVIYASKPVPIPSQPGNWVLCDFGDAQFGHDEYRGQVQPDMYRAPEIVLWAPWTEKIDIWNIGVLAWELVEGKRLFPNKGLRREAASATHLARMISLLGPPPKELLDELHEAGRKYGLFFDESGRFTADVPICRTSFEEELTTLQGEEKAGFLNFLRKMLQWDPKQRLSATELRVDKWINGLPPVDDEIVE